MFQDSACSFYVGRVPEAIFSTDESTALKAEFEAVFRPYGEDVTFRYLKSFGLVKVSFSTAEQAALAQSNLCNCEFKGVNLKMKPVKPIILGSRTLEIPQRTMQFLISPPASPPVGWDQSTEPTPCVDYSLVAALAKLQLPGSTQELHEGSMNTPSIVVETPLEEDSNSNLPRVLQRDGSHQQPIRMSALPPSTVQTCRPPLPQQL